MNVNNWHGTGRCAQVPQLKTYLKADGTTGYRCWFKLAVTRLQDRGEKDRGKQRTNFVSIVTWGEAAKRHAQYIGQGDEMHVQGELICESEQQADGSYREYTAVEARDIQYGSKALKNQQPDALNRSAENIQNRLNTIMAATASTMVAEVAEAAAVTTTPATEAPTTAEFGNANPFAPAVAAATA